jgi:hypothetical protein
MSGICIYGLAWKWLRELAGLNVSLANGKRYHIASHTEDIKDI